MPLIPTQRVYTRTVPFASSLFGSPGRMEYWSPTAAGRALGILWCFKTHVTAQNSILIW